MSSNEWDIELAVKKDENTKFLALATKVDELKKLSQSSYNNMNTNSNKNDPNTWRYEHVDGYDEMIRDDRKYIWCTNDYRKKPQ